MVFWVSGLGFGVGAQVFGWGLGLWVGSLDYIQNIQSFGTIKTLFSQKLKIFWLRNLFFGKT